jgi:hypothetical protein
MQERLVSPEATLSPCAFASGSPENHPALSGACVENRPGSGTYSVNADCTGTQILTFNVPGGQVVHTTFVIVRHGKQVLDVVTDPHVVITSVGKAVGIVDED